MPFHTIAWILMCSFVLEAMLYNTCNYAILGSKCIKNFAHKFFN